MTKQTHIVFTGGGTGGHLFPGLAVAEQLAARIASARITFAGSGRPFEQRHVEAAGFEYVALPCRPLPRRASEALSFVFENVAGYLAAGRFLDEEDVCAVVGLGGYASVPMGRAAMRRRLPLVLLEQNVVAGKANRWLARGAKLICTSFDETELPVRTRCPVRVTGNPIRRRLEPNCAAVRSQLLILGGSGGARALNENVPRALYKIGAALAGWRIVHQTGEAGVEPTRELYRKFALEAEVEAFWPDLNRVMAESTLAIGRAGGTTLAELAAHGLPAVLLPYPHATADHQYRNAKVFAAVGGAVIVDERQMLGRLDDGLAEELSPLLVDAPRRQLMGAAMHGLARPHAAQHVASLVWSLVSSQSRRLRPASAT